MSGGRIPRAFIDDLLARVDIVALIDAHVPLKKSGANFVARCPFHSEKTPSFSVNHTKQFYHCFGCGISGNAISFLMEFNHLDFVEAVEDLAVYAGLEVPRELIETQPAYKKDDISGLYDVMQQVSAFYYEQLSNHPEGKKAAAYLQARGLTGDVVKAYLLGYAPYAWKGLQDRFDPQLLLQGGLLGKNDDGGLYGRFRGRIMFPIRDKRGRVIGFGGRVLDDALPKYLNSPETAIFHKAKETYGLYELLQKNAKPQRIMVVEGYLDVIALAQFGIHYAVATLGTAVSPTHLELLFRYTSELVFCFDGDAAGRNAAWRAIASVFPALKGGRQIRIMLLPQAHDPDSLIREEGLDKFAERVKSAQVLSDYFFEHFAKDLRLSELESRSNLRNEAESYLKQLPIGAFREMMFEKLSGLTQRYILDSEAILAYKNQEKQHRLKSGRPSLTSIVMASLLQNPKLVEIVEQKNIDWNQLEFKGIETFKNIVQRIADTKPANFGALIEVFRNHEDEKIVKKLASLDLLIAEKEIEAEFTDALNKLIMQTRSARVDRLLSKEQATGLNQEDKDLLRKLLAHKK